MHPTTLDPRRPTRNAAPSLSRPGTYPGILRTRYDSSRTEESRLEESRTEESRTEESRTEEKPAVPWHNGLPSDQGSLFNFLLHDPDGRRGPVKDEINKFQLAFGSDYSESETVKSVDDLGFSDRITITETNASRYRDLSPNQLCAMLNLPKPGPSFNLESLVSRKIGKSLKCYKTTEMFRYLPLDAFDRIFTPQIIYSLLKEKFPKLNKMERVGKVNEVIGGVQAQNTLSPRGSQSTNYKSRDAFMDYKKPEKSRRRIFALLVFMKSLYQFDHFVKNNIYDSDFPLEDNEPHAGSSNGHNNFLDTWDESDKLHLYSFQYFFWVPYFLIKSGELRSYPFDSKTVLPWEYIKQEAHGGNGTVHKVQIHSAHFSSEDYQKSSDGPQYFALKEIEHLDREIYHQEFKALQKTCAHTHNNKHLIKLLLAFQRGDKYYLMFEWADGNLDQLWAENKQGGHSFGAIWAVSQCLGIAKAIARIHRLSSWPAEDNKTSGSADETKDWGRHGDIKPQNILWFKRYGEDNHVLVLSDLGLTRYHSIFTKSNIPNYRIDGFTGAYRPPEMDTGHHISPKYDIWSLGCVYLEFLLWYLQGHRSVKGFSIERLDEDDSSVLNVEEDKYFQKKFDNNDRVYAVIKPAVLKCIETLQNLDSCPKAIKMVLEVIESSMLVVNVDKRESILFICSLLTKILEDAKKESNATIEFKGALAQNVGGALIDGIVDRPTTLDIADEQEISGTIDSNNRKATLKRSESEPTYAFVAAQGLHASPMADRPNGHHGWTANMEPSQPSVARKKVSNNAQLPR